MDQPGCLSLAQDSLESYRENKTEIQRNGTTMHNQGNGTMLGLSRMHDDCIKIGETVGFPAIAHGNVVALHCAAHNRFIRIQAGTVDARGGNRDVDTLPVKWGSEQFLVLRHGGDDYSFYGISDGSFLRMEGTSVLPSACKSLTDKQEPSEVFQVQSVVDSQCAALYSAPSGRFVRMNDSGNIDADAKVAQAWEYFDVVLLMEAPESFVRMDAPETFVMVENL